MASPGHLARGVAARRSRPVRLASHLPALWSQCRGKEGRVRMLADWMSRSLPGLSSPMAGAHQGQIVCTGAKLIHRPPRSAGRGPSADVRCPGPDSRGGASWARQMEKLRPGPQLCQSLAGGLLGGVTLVMTTSSVGTSWCMRP